MNILVVTTSFPTKKEGIWLGGPFVLSECSAYEKAGAKVTVITPGVWNAPSEEIFGENIRVKRFSYFLPKKAQIIKQPNKPIYNKMNILFYLQFPLFLFFFMLAILRNIKSIDIIHCNWTLTALLALPAKWFYKKPIVLTIRGSDLRLIPKFINRYILKSVNGVIDCFGPYPENIKTIKKFKANYVKLPLIVKEPKGITPLESYPTPNSIFTIICIGRFDPAKQRVAPALFILLDALNILSKKYVLKCIYVGDGILKDALVKKTLELEMKDIVDFVGYQKNIYPYLGIAHLVMGGIALNAVAQEASISGKVQLIPNIEGWHENIWIDKENCLLYSADNMDSLSEKIEFAITHPDEIKRISMNTYNTAKKYIEFNKKSGDIYLACFEKIIEQNKLYQDSTSVSP